MVDPSTDDVSLSSGQRGHPALPGDTTGECISALAMTRPRSVTHRSASPIPTSESRIDDDHLLFLRLDDDPPRPLLDEMSEKENKTVDDQPPHDEMTIETAAAGGSRHLSRPSLRSKMKTWSLETEETETAVICDRFVFSPMQVDLPMPRMPPLSF